MQKEMQKDEVLQKSAIIAFLDGVDSEKIPNVIHSTEGAKSFGLRGPLVSGVTLYSWTCKLIVEVCFTRNST